MRPIAGSTSINSRLFWSRPAEVVSPRSQVSRRAFATGLFGLLAVSKLSAQRPHRIVSTAPSITEALFALGLGGQVVGVSQYCNFPPEVTKLPKIGSYIKPNLEAIVRLAPDLVVLQTAQPELTDRLKALQIRFVEVPHGTLNDVFTGINLIATASGVPERSNPLTSRIQRSLQDIRNRSRAHSSPRAIVIVSRRQGTLTDMTAVGPDNYLNELLDIAGGSNALAKPGQPRYPHISMETLIRENPDVIVDLSGMEESEAARQAEHLAMLSLWKQNPMLKAAHSGHIYFGTSNVLLVPGPRAPEAAEMLFHYLHDNSGGKQS